MSRPIGLDRLLEEIEKLKARRDSLVAEIASVEATLAKIQKLTKGVDVHAGTIHGEK